MENTDSCYISLRSLSSLVQARGYTDYGPIANFGLTLNGHGIVMY